MNDLNLEKKDSKDYFTIIITRHDKYVNRKKRVVQYDCMFTIFLSLYL